MAKLWIQGAITHPGKLKEALHVAADKSIPQAKIKKAMHSKNPSIAKMARLAETLHKMHHGKG